MSDEEGPSAEEADEDFLVGPPPPEVAEELDAGERQGSTPSCAAQQGLVQPAQQAHSAVSWAWVGMAFRAAQCGASWCRAARLLTGLPDVLLPLPALPLNPAASMDERTAEVARVMRVLAAHAAELAKASAAEAAERPPDAYDVLGVEHDAPAGGAPGRKRRLGSSQAGYGAGSQVACAAVPAGHNPCPMQLLSTALCLLTAAPQAR